MQSPSAISSHEFLRVEVAELKSKLDTEVYRNTMHEEEVSRLHGIIRKLNQEMFGPRKERWETAEQFFLFNEAEKLAKLSEVAGASTEVVEVAAHTKLRGKRSPLPSELPREVVVIDLAESEKVASDGSALRVIGEEVSEKLSVRARRHEGH